MLKCFTLKWGNNTSVGNNIYQKLWKAVKNLDLFRETILVIDFITFPFTTEKGQELMWKSFVTAAPFLLFYYDNDLGIYVFMGNKCLCVFLWFVRPSLNIILMTMVTTGIWGENNFQMQIKTLWKNIVEWEFIWSKPMIF